MNKKVTVTLAGIFLAIALALPSYVLIEATTEDLRQFNKFLQENQLPLDDTDVEQFIYVTGTRHQRLFAVLLIFELVFTILFAIVLWLSLKP
ncbi:MAG: hypothetical protein QXW63_00045 [Candidatus Bathyarchaeia archaeon]